MSGTTQYRIEWLERLDGQWKPRVLAPNTESQARRQYAQMQQVEALSSGVRGLVLLSRTVSPWEPA